MKHLLPIVLTSSLLLASCSLMGTPNSATGTPVQTGSGSTTSGSAMKGQSTFTAADIAAHNQASDCWASVDGMVYDLTDWVNRHPGGSEAIMGACGKDITSWEHPGGVPMAIQVKRLARYRLGALSQ